MNKDMAASTTPAPCSHCDDTGDVHSIDGEWRGVCLCPAGQRIQDRIVATQAAERVVTPSEQSECGCPKCYSLWSGPCSNESAATPPQQATPAGYTTQPITWGHRISEQVVKITKEAQAAYGYTHPIYATPAASTIAAAQPDDVQRRLNIALDAIDDQYDTDYMPPRGHRGR